MLLRRSAFSLYFLRLYNLVQISGKIQSELLIASISSIRSISIHSLTPRPLHGEIATETICTFFRSQFTSPEIIKLHYKYGSTRIKRTFALCSPCPSKQPLSLAAVPISYFLCKPGIRSHGAGRFFRKSGD